MDLESELDRIQSSVREGFERADRVRSFQLFLEDLKANPGPHLRTAPQYLLDMLEHVGTRASTRIGRQAVRFRIFDRDYAGIEPLLVGQERVQEEIYKHLLAAAKRGKADKMLLLHGPNGSGKTTLIECLVKGLEHYSRTDAGVLLRFNWIFTEREGRLDRIGFEMLRDEAAPDTYAFLDLKDISAKFHCELRDSPVFLIPREHRQRIIEEAVRTCVPENRPRFPYDFYMEGDLCQKCRKIYDALLLSYQGDWRKVLRHIQVERFYISKRYRVGAVSIEPQGNVDAGVRLVNSEHSWTIPTVLRNISLYEPQGDIVDANRGILEYSDFLKRPLEASKYLLTTCERGTVNLASCMAYLDLVIMATSNEKQLSLFKRSPDFSSFKGRMELIPVPYLLRFSTEIELYRKLIHSFAGDRHVTPHASEVAALWAVLTRLRKPNPKNYTGTLASVAPRLTPIEKAKLYDQGEPPSRFSDEERKALKAGILKIRQEFEEDEGEFEGIFGAEYEGRRGASAREMMSILASAAQMRKHRCLTPMAIFDALEELMKDSSVYDFLRLPAEGAYRDVRKFLDDVREEYFRWVTDEVYESINLIDESEYDRFFLEYFRHVKAYHTKEKVYNQRTNTYDPPNEDLLGSVERLLHLTDPRDLFRSHIITRIAAWSLDHPQVKIDYQQLFPEIYNALRENFYRERNRLLTLIEQDMLKYGTDEFKLLSPSEQTQVQQALESMRSQYNYCENCARDVIAYVLKYRTQVEERARREGRS
ncbi:MAG: serine protein kinase PrkA [Planctomycetes bacterium]|nr:serine protein kinase PrkA [Planctomycetota bacterium]